METFFADGGHSRTDNLRNKPINDEFGQQFAESHVIAVNFNWKLLALKSTLRLELSEEM
jgi:hypothetical protein